jgi:hypothetical protein
MAALYLATVGLKRFCQTPSLLDHCRRSRAHWAKPHVFIIAVEAGRIGQNPMFLSLPSKQGALGKTPCFYLQLGVRLGAVTYKELCLFIIFRYKRLLAALQLKARSKGIIYIDE